MGTVLQTTYGQPARGIKGQVLDTVNSIIMEYAVEDTTLGFARVVKKGTSDDQVVLATDASTNLGITVYQPKAAASDGYTAQYSQYDQASILSEGIILCDISNTGAKGSAVFYTDATGQIGLGTASTGQTQITGAKVLETVATAGDLAFVQFSKSSFAG